MTDSPCACSSGQVHSVCCQPFIDGDLNPATAEKLMRSRFCAFASKNQAYLLKTWDSSTCPEQLDLDKDQGVWTHLEVISSKKGGSKDTKGIVEFKAFFMLDGKEQVMHEFSRFIKNNGRWYYLDGKVKSISGTEAQVNQGKNAPCACGSGKKFKRCCGK